MLLTSSLAYSQQHSTESNHGQQSLRAGLRGSIGCAVKARPHVTLQTLDHPRRLPVCCMKDSQIPLCGRMSARPVL
eukprot:6176851-Pleurochrysis_carterae.AAC.1